jgi:hypothetical protein
VGETARIGGGGCVRVEHRERLIQVLGPQRLRDDMNSIFCLDHSRCLATTVNWTDRADLCVHLMGLEDVGEEGVGRAMGVGRSSAPVSAPPRQSLA